MNTIKEMEPCLSVIVPVYNTGKYLRQCLDSILFKQNVDSLELILVDDGSTDGSGMIIDEYKKADNRIRSVYQTNRGVSEARNQGLNAATGRYIAFVDSDDWLEENVLGTLCSKADSYECDMVMGNTFRYFSENEIERYRDIPEDIINRKFSGENAFIYLMRSVSFIPMVYNYIYRREWLEDIKLRFAKVAVHEDDLWCLISMCRARQIYITDIDVYYYRQREGSLISSLREETQRKVRVESLFHIVEKLFYFAKFYESRNEELQGWIYVKLFQLYYEGCKTLCSISKLDISSIEIPDISDLLRSKSLINNDKGEICSRYYNGSMFIIGNKK